MGISALEALLVDVAAPVMNGRTHQVIASVHQNHSRILANSEFIRPRRPPASG